MEEGTESQDHKQTTEAFQWDRLGCAEWGCVYACAVLGQA